MISFTTIVPILSLYFLFGTIGFLLATSWVWAPPHTRRFRWAMRRDLDNMLVGILLWPIVFLVRWWRS